VRSDFNRMLNLWRNGRLDLEGMITKRIAIDDVDQAVADLRAGAVIRSVITFADTDPSGTPAGAVEGSASAT
jgi:S-(hydroxymethyl)glutathione dehydrogenase/alcohol dehydrogenase